MKKTKTRRKTLIGIAIIIAVFFVLYLFLFRPPFWVRDYKISIRDDNTVTISDYRGDGSVEVPGKIGPFKVNSILTETFSNRDDITDIYFSSDFDPYYGTFIENSKNLKRIEFGAGIKNLYIYVDSCENLEEVVLPEGYEEFEGSITRCSKLQEIHFPSTIKSIDYGAFSGTKFEEIHSHDKYYVVGDNVLLYYNADYNEDIVIPNGVKHLDDLYLKSGTGERKIYVPDTMTTLDTQAYEGDIYYFGDNEFSYLDLNHIFRGAHGTIVAPEGSYVEKYCEENGYDFRVITKEEETERREKTEAAASEITYQE